MFRIFLFMFVTFCTSVCFAQPGYMNYQGTLVQENGEPLAPGQYVMEVNLYDAPEGGTKVWGPFYFDGEVGAGHAPFVSVMGGGRFNVIMGASDTSTRSLPAVFQHPASENRFIELRVDGGEPILPRQQFLSAPYAFQAGSLPNVYSKPSGNVGIGISEPIAKLDVNGNLKVRGDVEISGRVVTNGDMTVSGDITYGGKLSGFYLSGNYQISAETSQQETISTGLEVARNFCALTAVSSTINSNQSQSGCVLSIDSGFWELTAISDNDVAITYCNAICFHL